MGKIPENTEDKIFTIPNMLSVIRLCFIPMFVWLYSVKKDYAGTTVVLLLSGFTDILDGFIARRFNMISNLGKVLDPVADKLTQGAMFICLLTKYDFMWIALILLIIKEIFMSVTGLLVIKKTGEVYGAEWHGKVTTSMIYATVFIHLIWYNIPLWISKALIFISILLMIYSCVSYGIRNYRLIKESKIQEKTSRCGDIIGYDEQDMETGKSKNVF